MTQLGIGVLGLHEGRTLLVALNRPDFAPAHVRAVAGCDLRPEKIEAVRRSAQTGSPVQVAPILAEIGLTPSAA